jgi:hypothetical protein
MQLIPQTAKRFGVKDPFNPTQNAIGGIKYLRWLMDYYNNDFIKVIAAYNAGENAVDKYKTIPPFTETQQYVPKVLNLWANKSVQPNILPLTTSINTSNSPQNTSTKQIGAKSKSVPNIKQPINTYSTPPSSMRVELNAKSHY